MHTWAEDAIKEPGLSERPAFNGMLVQLTTCKHDSPPLPTHTGKGGSKGGKTSIAGVKRGAEALFQKDWENATDLLEASEPALSDASAFPATTEASVRCMHRVTQVITSVTYVCSVKTAYSPSEMCVSLTVQLYRWVKLLQSLMFLAE